VTLFFVFVTISKTEPSEPEDELLLLEESEEEPEEDVFGEELLLE